MPAFALIIINNGQYHIRKHVIREVRLEEYVRMPGLCGGSA